MACPHFSHEDTNCRLLEDAPRDDDESTETPVDDRVNREWCLADGREYLNCPIFRTYLADLLR